MVGLLLSRLWLVCAGAWLVALVRLVPPASAVPVNGPLTLQAPTGLCRQTNCKCEWTTAPPNSESPVVAEAGQRTATALRGDPWNAVAADARRYNLTGLVRPFDSWRAVEYIADFKLEYTFNFCANIPRLCDKGSFPAVQHHEFRGKPTGCWNLGEPWDQGGAQSVEWEEFGEPADLARIAREGVSEDNADGSQGIILRYRNGARCPDRLNFSFAIKVPCGVGRRSGEGENDGIPADSFEIDQNDECEFSVTFPPLVDGCPRPATSTDEAIFVHANAPPPLAANPPSTLAAPSMLGAGPPDAAPPGVDQGTSREARGSDEGSHAKYYLGVLGLVGLGIGAYVQRGQGGLSRHAHKFS